MTVNHKNGLTNKFYVLLKKTLKELKVFRKKADKSFKYDIGFEVKRMIKHIEDYIEENKSWLKG